MALLPLILKAPDPNTAFTSHLDNYKHAISNLVASIEQDGVLLSIDIKDFEPTEVTVTTVDNTIIVEGKHDDKVDTPRHFIRKYTLSTMVDIDDITTVSSDGLFNIYVPSKLKSMASSRVESTEGVSPIESKTEIVTKSEPNAHKGAVERIIPIQLTEDIIKMPDKAAIVMRNKKRNRKILRFENVPDTEEDAEEQIPNERLNKKKLFCCC